MLTKQLPSGKNEESLVEDYYITCMLRLLRSLATKVDVRESKGPIRTICFMFRFILVLRD